MKRTRIAVLAMSAGVVAAALFGAAPAQADPVADDFLSNLSAAGLTDIDPATAVSVGQDVCPMLAEPGQQMADVAGDVSEAIGKPLGPATMFTGLAITIFCPGAVSSLANGDTPIPLDFLGF
ncbi:MULTISPECIES: DUF732 domain-containing protein [unclassified Mycobacterium]|uniref:DUF732 domain-containing protein n=1 Tax=unclassified Mycobacterium TaxID=2642494 RepID=UPI0029C9AEEB|nr:MULTISPECIES: DUF732 domain-containing protein [unclassified Mycobacterium]